MKITITGASGFVGTNLSAFLKNQGNEVREISMRDEGWESMLDRKADVLIHLAGKAHDTSGEAADQEYFQINTGLTQRIFDEFLNSEIRDFFYFSSVKAAADSVEGTLDETVTPNPKTPYGISKLRAENHLLSKALPADKRLFIIRPCMIHGPGNKGNLNLLYKVVKKGIPWPLAAFDNKRSFLSIDNLSFLIWQMIQQTLPSGIYNVADDEPVSTNRLVQLIAGVTGKKAKLWKIPQKMISFAAETGDFLSLPLNRERLKKLTESYMVSNLKVKKALHIERLQISAEEGLVKTIQSFNN